MWGDLATKSTTRVDSADPAGQVGVPAIPHHAMCACLPKLHAGSWVKRMKFPNKGGSVFSRGVV